MKYAEPCMCASLSARACLLAIARFVWRKHLNWMTVGYTENRFNDNTVNLAHNVAIVTSYASRARHA